MTNWRTIGMQCMHSLLSLVLISVPVDVMIRCLRMLYVSNSYGMSIVPDASLVT